jgi:RNA polymerase sigma factor (sigma-70 family)
VGAGDPESDPELDDLVRLYEHRVSYFAGRVQRRFSMGNRWRDDLISAGYWGLFKALRNRRDGAHERELSAYVSRRIEGAVIDEARCCLARSSRADTVVGSRLHGLEDAAESNDGLHRSSEPWRMPTVAAHEGPEERTALSWRRSAIDEALSGLEPAQRSVLHAYMEGDSLSEIARSEGVSAGTMQVRFQKLTRSLRASAPALRRILLDSDHT